MPKWDLICAGSLWAITRDGRPVIYCESRGELEIVLFQLQEMERRGESI